MKRPQKGCVLLLFLLLSSNLEVYSQSEKSTASFLEVYPVSIPESLGRVVSYRPSSKPGAPLLILFQDAHVQYDAQKKLADMLQHMVTHYGLSLVLVEGGAGDVDLSYLRQGVAQTHVEEVAQRHLSEGSISGEEYLDLIYETDLIRLWGVENADLYAKNMKAYLRFEPLQEKALTKLAELLEKARDLKVQSYSPDFYEISVLRDRSMVHSDVFFDYLQKMFAQARNEQVNLDLYPALQWLAEVREEYRVLDSSKVELEKDQLMLILNRLATKEELYDVKTRLEKVSPDGDADLYRALLALKRSYGRDLQNYSSVHIEKALQLAENMKLVKGDNAFEEAEQLYFVLRDKEVRSKGARNAAWAIDYLELLSRLFKFEWVPADEKRYRELLLKWHPSRLKKYWGSDASVRELEFWSARARNFYLIAGMREKAIVQNVADKILAELKNSPARDDGNLPIFALIIGGFHAAQIQEALATRGIGVISVAPNFEVNEASSDYFKILKEKWGSGQAWSRHVSS